MAIVFIDTEFTDLLLPELLSFGLVTLDDREHYVELDLTTDIGKARVKASGDFRAQWRRVELLGPCAWSHRYRVGSGATRTPTRQPGCSQRCGAWRGHT